MVQKKIVIHWFGSPYHKLSLSLQRELSSYFSIRDFGGDISELTNPDVTYACFYCHGLNVQNSLQLVTKICQNLKKLLIIFHEGNVSDTHASPPLQIKTINTLSNDCKQEIQALHRLIEGYHHAQVPSFPMNLASLENKEVPHQKYNATMHDIVSFIDEHFTHKLSIHGLAAQMNCSIYYFSKQFHHQMGIRFQDYIINKRIELAKQLLSNAPNEKIYAIAYRCGYHDISYFSRIFKKRTSMTPQQYREKTIG